ncbi:MAG: T9SS type A sorting domain-containing protein, partial [Bacteroidota bacterium]
KYLTILFLFVGFGGWAQENEDSTEAITGDNLIICWTLGEVVAGYGGFDKNLESTILNQVKFSISAMEKTNAAQLVKIHPNPTADFVVVHLKQVKAEGIVLQDQSGNVLLRKHLPKSTKSYELNLSTYDDGIYYLAINTEDDDVLEKFRVVKNSRKY